MVCFRVREKKLQHNRIHSANILFMIFLLIPWKMIKWIIIDEIQYKMVISNICRLSIYFSSSVNHCQWINGEWDYKQNHCVFDSFICFIMYFILKKIFWICKCVMTNDQFYGRRIIAIWFVLFFLFICLAVVVAAADNN